MNTPFRKGEGHRARRARCLAWIAFAAAAGGCQAYDHDQYVSLTDAPAADHLAVDTVMPDVPTVDDLPGDTGVAPDDALDASETDTVLDAFVRDVSHDAGGTDAFDASIMTDAADVIHTVDVPTRVDVPDAAPANQVVNPSFETPGSTGGLPPWTLYLRATGAGTLTQDTTTATDGRASAQVTVTTGSSDVDVQLRQSPIVVIAGRPVTLRFAMKASNAISAGFNLQQGSSPYTPIYAMTFNVTTTWQTFTFTFTPASSDPQAILRLNVGTQPGTVWIDAVSFSP